MPKATAFSKLEGFEWDGANLEHIAKHNVKYSECEQVFQNEQLVIFFDKEHSKIEKRYKIYGESSTGRRLAIAITVRKNKIRVVTARGQSRKERGENK